MDVIPDPLLLFRGDGPQADNTDSAILEDDRCTDKRFLLTVIFIRAIEAERIKTGVRDYLFFFGIQHIAEQLGIIGQTMSEVLVKQPCSGNPCQFVINDFNIKL